MPSPSKAKGYRHERKLVEMATASGLDSRRAWGSDGRSLGLPPGVDLEVEMLRIQAKKQKALPVWFRDLVSYLEECNAVVVSENHGEHFVIMNYVEFLDLVKMAKGQ